MERDTPEQLTLSLGDSHASHSVLPGSDKAQQMTVRSGRRCSELFGKSGPVGLLVKTLLESSTWNSTVTYLTWKAKATPRGRLLFQLAPSMPDTEETGCGLLPTPTSQNAKHGAATDWEIENRPNHLHVIAALWPTPAAQDAKNATLPPSQIDRDTLPGAILRERQMWPTPRAGSDVMCGGTGHWQMLQGTELETGRGNLNPQWVEWLMGYPIEHTALNPSVTPLSRKSPRKSSTPSKR